MTTNIDAGAATRVDTEAARPTDDEAHARALAGGALHQCDFDAYSTDRDGLDVRAAPSPAAPVLGKLPRYGPDPDLDRDTGPYVTVLAARDGWFHIRSYEDKAPLAGWVNGRFLGFDLQTDVAFAAPRTDAAIVATAWEDKDGAHPFASRRPSDCKGKWVKLEVAGRDGIAREAWAAGVCANQDTTCDGVYGTWRARAEK